MQRPGSPCGRPRGRSKAACPACLPSGVRLPCSISGRRTLLCFTWASVGAPRGPLTPELFSCCGAVLPRQSQAVPGPAWGSPLCLPEGLGLPPGPDKGCISRARSHPSSPRSRWQLWASGLLPPPFGIYVFQGSDAWLVGVLVSGAEPASPSGPLVQAASFPCLAGKAPCSHRSLWCLSPGG